MKNGFARVGLLAVFALVCLTVLVAPAVAETFQVGDVLKLETGFGAPYSGNLRSVAWSYKIYSQYVELDPASLSDAACVTETEADGVIAGVYSCDAREGVVSAPAFRLVGATPLVDGARELTNIFDVTVTAESGEGEAIDVALTMPEAFGVAPKPAQPPVEWLFRWVRSGGD